MSKKHSARDALIDTGWRFGSCIGLAFGLLAAVDTRPHTPRSCSDSSPAGLAKDCFSDGLLAGVKPYLICMGAGLLVGALMGALIMRGAYVLVALVRQHVSARRTTVPASPATGASAVPAAARRMVARYSSPCASCGQRIEVGTLIEHRGPRQTICGVCATSQPSPAHGRHHLL